MEQRKVKLEDAGRIIEGIQFTLLDERWYLIDEIFYPSVTYIQGIGFPEPEYLKKWRGGMSYLEANRIRDVAGDRGSLIHDAIESAINGKTLKQGDYEIDVWDTLVSVKNWVEDYKPTTIKTEYTVYSKKHWFAGTVDYKCLLGSMNGARAIIDWKSGSGLHINHETQIASYDVADIEMGAPVNDVVMIVRFGTQSARGYEVKIVEDRVQRFKMFKAVHFIFRALTSKTKPDIKIYPTTISLNIGRVKDNGGKSIRKGRTKSAGRRTTKK